MHRTVQHILYVTALAWVDSSHHGVSDVLIWILGDIIVEKREGFKRKIRGRELLKTDCYCRRPRLLLYPH